MNDFFSGSLLEMNKTALEHEHKLTNWPEVVRQCQADERKIQEIARISNMIKKSSPIRTAWYCPLLERMGIVMVSLGTRLKANYSTDHALRSR
jgi:hypothetical protein